MRPVPDEYLAAVQTPPVTLTPEMPIHVPLVPTMAAMSPHRIVSATAPRTENVTKNELRARLLRIILENEQARQQEVHDYQ